jgi:ABC-type oligopeptide transport system substrate-binding subunit/class 3 adenylate cyclase
MPASSEQVLQLEETIARLEAQRALLGDAVVEAALAPLRQQLAALRFQGAQPGSALAGERKLVTILFADLSGFTALTENLDAEVARDLVNACFERLVPPIEQHGGVVDKFLGDGVMALFGAPVAHENDAERALRAALAMRQALADFNQTRQVALGIHFGINTGLVVAGGIGTRGQQSYSVLGDAVNVAARLEEISERGEILVGPETYRLTQARFEFEVLEPVRVKGKHEALEHYRLQGLRLTPGRERGLAGLDSPLVGRQAQFQAMLRAAHSLASAGQSRVITLVGEAGLGKSRLVAELHHRLAEQVQWVEGRCISFGAAIPYLPWLEVLRSLLGLTGETPPAEGRQALLHGLAVFCPEQAREITPVLLSLLALPEEPAEALLLRDLDGARRKAAIFQAVAQVLSGAARQRPLVVVIEDLHWADPTSLDLLTVLLGLMAQAPLLFVCPFRPEKEHGCWQFRLEAAERFPAAWIDLTLEPLTAEESQALVRNLLKFENLPVDLRNRILSHAEGNPFYVEELIRSLMESQAIAYNPETGCWVAIRPVEEIAIPNTLQGVLMARIDRLQEETKRVLQLAAVIGRVFFYRVLAAIAAEQYGLDRHLLTLQDQEMIRERARVPELEYIFKHHLTQEAAYNGLLKKDRRLFHSQVAEALEGLFADRRSSIIGLLAYHWERAEEADKAVTCLLEAGDQARLAYNHREALSYYERALALLRQQNEPLRTARTLLKLGLAYHMAFDFPRSRQAYDEGFALLQQGEQAAAGTLPPAPHPLRALFGLDPTTLDPAQAEDAASINIIFQLFAGLVTANSELDILPDLARSWEVLADGRQVRFQLRDGLCWSDGVPLTAADFEFAWKRALDPRTAAPNALLLYDLKGARDYHQGRSGPETVGVRALDDHTLLVELEEPIGYFLHLLLHAIFAPLPRHTIERYGPAWLELDKLVVCGPFLLESWARGQAVRLCRNPRYHGQSGGNVTHVELTLSNILPPAALEMYEAGQIDQVLLAGPILETGRLRHAEDYRVLPVLITEYVGFNLTVAPFDLLPVRLALALTTDRERLANEVQGTGNAPADGGFIPRGMPGYTPGINLPFDPERARRLLAEAGFPEGRGFPVTKLQVGNNQVTMQYLADQWRAQLGISVEVELIPWGAYVELLRRAPPGIYWMGWQADYPDPDNFLRVGFWRERVHWEDETFIGLVEQARVMVDQRRRIQLYQQADQRLVEQAILMPLTYGRTLSLYKPWIRRVPLSPLGRPAWRDVVIEPH